MAQNPYGAAYPTAVNAAVHNEVEKHKKKEKSRNRGVLNNIGVLRDDPDRQRFVVKTYGILTVQLTYTVVLCGLILSSDSAKQWVRDNYWLHYVCLIFGFAIMCSLLCC